MKRLGRLCAGLVMLVLTGMLSLALVGCGGNGGSDSQPADGAGDGDGGIPITDVAFVLTTDLATGSYSVVDLATRETFNDITPGGVNSDAVPARLFNGRIYVVNRFGADNIQVLDPQQGYTTVAQESVGNGTNPQDIAFVDAEKAYVSRYASAILLSLNPTTLAAIGEDIDLSYLTKPDDMDGAPELAQMLMHDGLLYVTMQHVDLTTGFPPVKVAPGEVVVIDPTTDTVNTVIPLNGTNPLSELQFSPALDRILVSSVGDFGVQDGGIEAIDPTTHEVDPEFVIDETSLGGDITHFQIVSATKGFAIVSDANFASALVSFDPSTGNRLSILVGPVDTFVPHFAINGRNELYLAVTEPMASGLRIFDIAREPVVELTDDTLSVGLPPFFVLFIE